MDMKAILSSKRILLYIFLAGFIARLLLGLWFRHSIDYDCSTIIARNILSGNGYSLDGIHPTAFRAPGFPIILAILIALFSEYTIPLVILRAIIGGANACLCAWLGMKIFNRRTGIISGILYIIVPYLAQKEVVTELGFATFGLLAGLCLLWKGWNAKKVAWIIPSTLMFSFAYLVRPDIGIIPVFISFCLLIGVGRSARTLWHLKAAVTLIAIFIIGISPWAIRNKITFGRWYAGQTFLWRNIYMGNHPLTFGIYPVRSLDTFFSVVPKEKSPIAVKGEFEMEEWFRKQALIQIKKLGPENILKYSLRKMLYLWNIQLVPYKKHLLNNPRTGKPYDINRHATDNLIFSIPYIFLVTFALIGCWQECRRPKLLLFIFGLLLSFSLPYTINFAYSRYTTQVYFVLIIMAARGLASFSKAQRC